MKTKREEPTITCLGQYAGRVVYISDECFTTCQRTTYEEYKTCPFFQRVDVYEEEENKGGK